jgi:hypothetical protein
VVDNEGGKAKSTGNLEVGEKRVGAKVRGLFIIQRELVNYARFRAFQVRPSITASDLFEDFPHEHQFKFWSTPQTSPDYVHVNWGLPYSTNK